MSLHDFPNISQCVYTFLLRIFLCLSLFFNTHTQLSGIGVLCVFCGCNIFLFSIRKKKTTDLYLDVVCVCVCLTSMHNTTRNHLSWKRNDDDDDDGFCLYVLTSYKTNHHKLMHTILSLRCISQHFITLIMLIFVAGCLCRMQLFTNAFIFVVFNFLLSEFVYTEA